MIESESRINGESRQSAFGIVLGFTERATKTLTVFVGTIYVIGYIVTAARLAQYGIPTIRLIDLQYLAAGLLPGLLVWLTILVLVSASLYHFPKKNGRSTALFTRVGVLMIIFFAIAFVMELLGYPSAVDWADLGRSVANISYSSIRFVLGELALWFLIAGLRTKFFSELIGNMKRNRQDTGGVFSLIGLAFVLAVVNFYRIPSMGWEVYNSLPQAYGGAKPIQVQLYVDGSKVPSELLVAKSDMDSNSPARTTPLNLIFQTSGEFIVDPLEDNSQRAWVLKSDAVYAVYILEVGFR